MTAYTEVFVALDNKDRLCPTGRAIANYVEVIKLGETTKRVVESFYSPDGSDNFRRLLDSERVIDEGQTDSWTLECPGVAEPGQVERSGDQLTYLGQSYKLEPGIPSIVISRLIFLPETNQENQ